MHCGETVLQEMERKKRTAKNRIISEWMQDCWFAKKGTYASKIHLSKQTTLLLAVGNADYVAMHSIYCYNLSLHCLVA